MRAKACALGINEAGAFLVPARGNGRDNRTSPWAETIERRIEKAERRAKPAFRRLDSVWLIGSLCIGTEPKNHRVEPAATLLKGPVIVFRHNRPAVGTVTCWSLMNGQERGATNVGSTPERRRNLSLRLALQPLSALVLRLLLSSEAFPNGLVDGIAAAIYATHWRSPAAEWKHLSDRSPTWERAEALSEIKYLRFFARRGQ